MKIGFFGINVGACADPVVLERVARTAEAAGFESLWTGEHIVLPDPHQVPSPSPPETPFLDSAVALTFAAAHTARVKLGTGIVILPQRNPLVLAKEMVRVDVLSNGRLILGVASGYLHQEFAALGIPFNGRGPRTDEYIDAIREMWTAETPKFEGHYVKFADVNAQPRPVQKPTPPIVIGGQSAPVMHPGPMNRGVEIDSRVADGASAVILPQVTFGIAVRMAALSIAASSSRMQ